MMLHVYNLDRVEIR